MSIPTLFLAASLLFSFPQYSQEDAPEEQSINNTTCTLSEELNCTLAYSGADEATKIEYAVRFKGRNSSTKKRNRFSGQWQWSVELIVKSEEGALNRSSKRSGPFVLSMRDIDYLLVMLSSDFDPSLRFGIPGATAGDKITWASTATNSSQRISLDFLVSQAGQWSHQIRMRGRTLASESEPKFIELLKSAKAVVARVSVSD